MIKQDDVQLVDGMYGEGSMKRHLSVLGLLLILLYASISGFAGVYTGRISGQSCLCLMLIGISFVAELIMKNRAKVAAMICGVCK